MNDHYQARKIISISDCDPKGRVKPSAILVDMQELAELHAMNLGLPRQFLIGHGMMWVLYRLRLVMREYPSFGDMVVETTWPGPVEGPVFPRHFAFERPDGTRLGEAVTSWVLINLATRRPLRPSALPKPVPALERDAPLPLPGMLRVEGAAPIGERSVRYTDLDVNGHMNNTRYLDWILDTLEVNQLIEHGLADAQVNYISEALPGETIELFAGTDGKTTYVQGRRPDGKTVFEARAVMA